MGTIPKFEVFFEGRGGEGPLALYFSPGPYGDAVEALAGNGVGFFGENDALLAVQFDRVVGSKDHQTLRFDNGTSVEMTMSNDKAKVVQAHLTPSSKSAA